MTAAQIHEPDPRPRRMARSERRAQLLETAREVFTRCGYHAAAMEEIADEAGVSKPVLYQHFASKLDLYVALLEGSSREIVSGVVDALSAMESGEPDATDETVRRYFALASSADSAFRLIFESDLIHDSKVRQIVDQTIDECAEAIAPYIQANTSLTDEEARLLGAGAANTALAASRTWLTMCNQAEAEGVEPEISRERAVELVSRLIWLGAGGGFPPGS